MAMSPAELRRRRLNMLMAMSYATFASTKASTATAGATSLLGNEWNGLTLDFTDNTYAVRVSTGAETLLGSGPNTAEVALGLDFTDNTSAVRY